MRESKSARIQGKPTSISELRRSPRFILPNQPQTDTMVPNSESSLDLVFDSIQKSSIDKSRKLRRSKESKVKENHVSSRSVTESATGKRRPARQNGAGEGCCFRRSPRFSIVKCLDREKFKQEDRSKDCDRGKRQISVSKINGQGSNGCSQSDATSKSRSRRCRKKVSERSEADDSVAVSMVEEPSKALNAPKIFSNNSGKRVTRSTSCATAHKDNDLDIDIGIMAEPIRSVNMKEVGNQVDKKQVRSKRKITSTIDAHPSVLEMTTRLELKNINVHKDNDPDIGFMTEPEPIRSMDMKEVGTQVDKKQVGSKRKITPTIDVHPSVLERTTGLVESKDINAAEEQPMVQGWTKEQELALQGAYFSVKPTPHFWKKVAKMVPGKSAQECFEKINSDILTPSQPQRRSVSKRTSSLSFSLSPSILLTPSDPTSKKPRRGKGKQCSYKNVRHLLNKQSKTEQKGGADLFSVLEPSFGLSTQSVQNGEVGSKGERSLSTHRNDRSGHSDRLRDSFYSPPVLKQIKNKALHEKYIDQLHMREAKRNVASKKSRQSLKGKNDAKESQVPKEEAIGRAKSSLIVNARSAINQFLQLQSTFTGDSDDGNDDVDDIEEDELENSL